MTQNEGTLKELQNEGTLKELQSIIDKQDDRIQKLQSTAFQLANYYFVFQGVIFTVISNGNSSVKCRDVWFPFILSVIAAMLNVFALLMIGNKYKRLLDQQDQNWSEYEMKKSSQQPSVDQPNSNNVNSSTRKKQPNQDPFTQLQRKVYLFLCMGFFVGFSLLTIFGCWWILCRENVLNKLDDDKCVKLCEGKKCIRVCPNY